jgi:hypothetical protein
MSAITINCPVCGAEVEYVLEIMLEHGATHELLPKRKKYIPSTHSKRQAVLNKSNGHCFYCGCDLTLETLHMEHFIAKANDGVDSLYNLVPSCESCNRLKGTLSIEEFRQRAISKGVILAHFYFEMRGLMS